MHCVIGAGRIVCKAELANQECGRIKMAQKTSAVLEVYPNHHPVGTKHLQKNAALKPFRGRAAPMFSTLWYRYLLASTSSLTSYVQYSQVHFELTFRALEYHVFDILEMNR
jgi:hypothetical protein